VTTVTKPNQLQPFLSSVATATRPFQSALPAIDTPVAPSPWTPKATPARPPPPPIAIDVEALRAEAVASGRAEGLRETAALRDRLAAVLRELEVVRAAIVAPTATQIADAAVTVVSAWVANEDKRALFAPIVAAWCGAGQTTGVAHVHPADAEALTAAIGELPITVALDADIAPGDVAIQNAGFELAHRWESRLPELRDAIARALESAP
jgi:flagellar biosynthesis/type III secretory pathway protein FliH